MASSSTDTNGLDLGEVVTPEKLAEILGRPVPSADSSKRARDADAPVTVVPSGESGKRFKLRDDELDEARDALSELWPFVKTREQENNAAFAEDRYPEWRLAPEIPSGDGTPQERVLDGRCKLTTLLSCDDPVLKEEGAVLIDYKQLQLAINDAVNLSLLGQHASSYRTKKFLEKSNRETLTLLYAMDNAETLLRSVPAEGGRYRLTPMQRIATALMLRNPANQRVSVEMKQYKGTKGCAAVYSQDPGQEPNFLVNNLSVASGKTWETVFATMSTIATAAGWKAAKAAYAKQKAGGSVRPCGLTRRPPTDDQESLCRVVVALVPPPMVKHWVDTSEKLAATFGQAAWITWTGSAPLKRATKTEPGIKRILPEAIKLTRERKCALFWVMEANTKSSFAATRTAPNFCLPFRVIDEGTGQKHLEPRNNDPESKYLKTIICNATLDQLIDRTTYQPKHPLKVALNGNNLNLDDYGHCALMSMLTVPSWVRLAVAQSLASMMPQGILKISMRVRVTSLAGRLNKSDMVIRSVDDLIHGLVLRRCGTGTSPEEKRDLEDKCRAILTRAVPSVSIADSLMNAVAQVAQDRDAMPEITWKPLGGAAVLCEDDRRYWRDLEHQKRVYNNMERLFKQLHEAIAGDPPPECPVTLEPIAPKNVCLCPHCAALLDREVVHRLQKCPCCRASWADGVVSATQVASVVTNQSVAPVAADPTTVEAGVVPGDLASLIRAYKTAANDKCGSSLDAVVKSIRIALQYKRQGLRILLCCSVYGEADHSDEAKNEQENTRLMRDFIRSACPELTSVFAVGKGGESIATYTAEDDTNRVLVIDTSKHSTTMAGLNLQMTDLLLFDRLEGKMGTAKLVQSIGRILRAQKRTTKQHDQDRQFYRTHGVSVHAPKLVVFIDEISRS